MEISMTIKHSYPATPFRTPSLPGSPRRSLASGLLPLPPSPSSTKLTATCCSSGSHSNNAPDIEWQPVFRFLPRDLLTEAPLLRADCGDFDWKAKSRELRALAKLSLQIKSENVPEAGEEDSNIDTQDTWSSAGIALASVCIWHLGAFYSQAFAAEDSFQQQMATASSNVPSWLSPTLLAFPLVSYGIFAVYRSQVNPYAKVTDWLFGMAAFVIIANLVLIATIGVRLY